jgi:hypothetical protein
VPLRSSGIWNLQPGNSLLCLRQSIQNGYSRESLTLYPCFGCGICKDPCILFTVSDESATRCVVRLSIYGNDPIEEVYRIKPRPLTNPRRMCVRIR